MIMDKKVYMQPSLKAHDMDEELLAAVSDPIIDENDESVDLARQSGWGLVEEEQGARKTRSVWDEE